MAEAVIQPRHAKGTIALAVAALLLIPTLCQGHGNPPQPSPGESLCARADALNLAADPYWRLLLHYRPRLTGPRSLVDDPDFFLSPEGKWDPRAELHATVQALFAAPPHEADAVACRFPARLEWLREQLDLDRETLRLPRCDEFERIIESIDPVSLTLTFPTAYLNSPASLFGHTLLHIRSSSDSALLSNAVSYAASTEETNGLVFAFKGIFGMYPGYYNVTPYYQKVQQYNDIDQRDIWEYELDLTPREIRRLMTHVYEFRDIYADYYFFTENCAYDLLFLLDAARPGLDLSASTRPWVIPLDTVKLVARKGLVRRITYRPSRATRLKAMATDLTPQAQRQAIDIATGKQDPTNSFPHQQTDAETIRTLDLAAEYLQLLRGTKEISREEYSPRFFKTLQARSRLGQADLSDYPTPALPRPDHGHGSLRLSLAGGIQDGRTFQQLTIRPAYHDGMDPDDGYVDGATIEFMGLTVRYPHHARHLRLERFDALRIESLTPRDAFLKPVSWKVHTGLERERMRHERHTAAFLTAGGGAAWRINAKGLAYTLVEADLRLADYDPDWSLGAGAVAGVLQQLGSRWKTRASVGARRYSLGHPHTRIEAAWAQRYTITQALAVTLDLTRRNQGHAWETELLLALHAYF